MATRWQTSNQQTGNGAIRGLVPNIGAHHLFLRFTFLSLLYQDSTHDKLKLDNFRLNSHEHIAKNIYSKNT